MTDKDIKREPKTLEDFVKIEKRLCEMCKERGKQNGKKQTDPGRD